MLCRSAVIVVLLLPLGLMGQSASSPIQVYGGSNYLSNSFNGSPGAHQPLMGWNAGTTFPWYRHLRVVIDISELSGTNRGAQQRAVAFLGGGQYEVHFRGEGLFAEALAGDAGVNQHWGPRAVQGDTASFMTFLGGGIDTPVAHGLAFRVEGGWDHTNLALVHTKSRIPYHLPGLPNDFGRVSAGLVWTAHRHEDDPPVALPPGPGREPVASELVFEGLNSFGHYHIFAYTWWSYLTVGGIEYDRHTWGTFIGARMDYVAEVLPVVILRQPKVTDVFGDPLFRVWPNPHVINEGLGISPIGLRMMWRDGRSWKPYYEIKGGAVGFTHKALSNYASYVNFSLQQSIGMQLRLSSRWDFRCGFSDFHFSNGFMVPNNPGIDEMAYSGGLSYHLGRRTDTE